MIFFMVRFFFSLRFMHFKLMGIQKEKAGKNSKNRKKNITITPTFVAAEC